MRTKKNITRIRERDMKTKLYSTNKELAYIPGGRGQ
jgi:hypothetical protein